jgi:hypothetical protein
MRIKTLAGATFRNRFQLPSVRSTCLHESAHTASLIIDGQTPLAVMVDVWSGANGVMGRVVADWENHDLTPKTVTAQLVCVLAGPVFYGGEPQVDITCWPIAPHKWRADGNVSDGEQAKVLVEWLKLDRISWGRVCHKVAERVEDRHFRRLVSEVARALQDVGELHQSDLHAIAERVPER